MPSIAGLFPKTFLNAALVKMLGVKTDDGSSVRATIDHLGQTAPDPTAPSDRKPCLILKETSKKFILNVTNTTALGEALGDDYDQWKGKEVAIYLVSTTKGDGVRVGAFRDNALTIDKWDATFDAGLAELPSVDDNTPF